MNKSINSRQLLYAFLVTSTFVLKACDDSMHASYASAAAARADGGVARGWIPEELPDSAYSISESHDLDTNTGGGSFNFEAADADALRAKLKPALPTDFQRFGDTGELQRVRYAFYLVPEFVLAVNWQTRHVNFVLVLQRK